jgi:hypothetical protein
MSDQLYSSNNLTGTNIVTGSASAADATLVILVATQPGTLSGTVQVYSEGNNTGVNGNVAVNGVSVSGPAVAMPDAGLVVAIPITTPTALAAGDVVELELDAPVAAATQLSATASIS